MNKFIFNIRYKFFYIPILKIYLFFEIFVKNIITLSK